MRIRVSCVMLTAETLYIYSNPNSCVDVHVQPYVDTHYSVPVTGGRFNTPGTSRTPSTIIIAECTSVRSFMTN